MNEYYKEITRIECLDIISNYGSDFISDEIEYLISNTNLSYEVIRFEAHMIEVKEIMSVIYIYKLPDEWFILVNIQIYEDTKYYKCDQLNGLTQLLNDI